MQRVAILPLIMAGCYLGLIIYFKVAHGGYKAVDLTASGAEAGEHTPGEVEIRQAEEAGPTG